MKTTNLLWAASLLLIGICTLFLVGSGILGLALPDPVRRGLGVIDLAALAVSGYTTVRKLTGNRE